MDDSSIYPETPLVVPADITPEGSPKFLQEASSFSVVFSKSRASTCESPEPNCPICLGKSENKSFTDSCFHQFCFTCLLEWSKVQAVCPLCKQPFRSIIHNVRSNNQYDQYEVPAPQSRNSSDWTELQIIQMGRRFRYRTTMTPDAMRLMSQRNAMYDYLPTEVRPRRSTRNMWSSFQQTSSSDFRRAIYYHDMWVEPVSDLTGRYRECSPEFYRNNPASTHRLIPWLNRELNAILENPTSIMYVMEFILYLITVFDICAPQFRDRIIGFVRDNTDHFIHEFYSFARSPFDMVGYDQHIHYPSRRPTVSVPSLQSVVSDDDSDVIVLSPEINRHSTFCNNLHETHNPEPPSSRSALLNCVANRSQPSTSGQSDLPDNVGSSGDEVEIIEVMKPRHERTPVIITLSETESEEHIRPRRAATKRNYIFSDSDSSCDSTPVLCKKPKVRTTAHHRLAQLQSSESEIESPETPSAYKPRLDRSKFRENHKQCTSKMQHRNPPRSVIVVKEDSSSSHTSSSSRHHHKLKKTKKHKHRKHRHESRQHRDSDSSTHSKSLKLKIRIKQPL